MTIQTAIFNVKMKKGSIRKTGFTGGFFDGNKYHERKIWYDFSTGDWFVVLNGEAVIFKALTTQDDPDIIKGRI